MENRMRYLDKAFVWLMSLVILLPNILNFVGNVNNYVQAESLTNVVDTVLYDGPDGKASVQATLDAEESSVLWTVNLDKAATEKPSAMKLEIDASGGGLGAPYAITTSLSQEDKEGILQIQNLTLTPTAESQVVTFRTDITDESFVNLSLRLLIEIVDEETQGPVTLYNSPLTKTITFAAPIPIVEESEPVEEIPEEPVVEEVESEVVEESMVEEETIVSEELESEENIIESSTSQEEKPLVEESKESASSESEVSSEVQESKEKESQNDTEDQENLDSENFPGLIEGSFIEWSPVPEYTIANSGMQSARMASIAPSYTNDPLLGTFPTNYTQSDTNVRNNNPQQLEFEGGLLSKYATKTATSGEFDINLRVEGKTITSTETIDIVIVNDNSGSMASKNRRASANAAISSFINNLLDPTTNSEKNIRIALVTFGGGLQDNNSIYTFQTERQILINKLPNDPNGGTHTQAALVKAAEVMATSQANTKVIVVVSDGVPTYSYKATTSTPNTDPGIIAYNGIPAPSRRGTVFSNTRLGDASSFNLRNQAYSVNGYNVLDHGWAVMSQAVLMKNAGLEIYGLGIQVGGDYGANTDQAANVMKNIASPGKYYNAAQVSEISSILADIAVQISKSIVNGVVDDPMGDMVALNTGNNSTFDANDYTLTGSPGLNLSEITVNADASGKITMKNLNLGKNEWINLKYKVNIKTEDASFKPEFYYQTNGRTTLTPKAINPNNKVDFPIPSVKAPGKLISGKKTWENDAPADRPENISIQLKRYVGTDPTSAVNVGAPITVNAGNNWTYTLGTYPVFNNKGKMFQYVVEETPVDGYITTYKGYNITNRLLKTDLTVKKVSEDGKPITGNTLKAEFTLSKGTNQTVVETDPDTGLAIFTNLTVGTYTLQETLAPAGYTLDPTVYTVTITQNGDNLDVTISSPTDDNIPSKPFVVINKKTLIDIPVEKKWVDDDNIFNQRPTDITVNLYQNNETEPIRTLTLTSEKGWKDSFIGLPEKDTTGTVYQYTVKEAPVPNYETTVEGFEITNTLKLGSLTITKYDKENPDQPLLLDGAEFEMQLENGTIAMDIEGNPLQGTTVNGKLVFKSIPYGTYTLVETKAPAGYQLPSKQWTIVISDEENPNVLIEIVNKKQSVLPSTGGIGTPIFTMMGLIIMITAGLSFIRKNEK